jgi:lipoprotein-anchoring transpeptidase ErfK/SrfK
MNADQYFVAAKIALQKGEKGKARQLALKTISLNPKHEGGWLILAAVDAPEAAISHLKRVLQINPNNTTAQKGLAWLQQTFAATPTITKTQKISPPPSVTPPPSYPVHRKQLIFPWILLFIALSLFLVTKVSTLIFPQNTNSVSAGMVFPNPDVPQASLTPTDTPVPTSTPTPQPSPTATPTSIPTFTPTNTPNPSPTPNKAAKKKKQTSASAKKNTKDKGSFNTPISPPKGVGKSEHWIEVDLSSQRSYAYIGETRVKSFIVSTGTWLHPTVTGVFRIYVKYKYANMSGPGYFLPNVPNVMYFYKDYGLHGTYWHNNFGTPMSHGCVNYSIKDSAWLYDFVDIGTIVYIHQ